MFTYLFIEFLLKDCYEWKAEFMDDILTIVGILILFIIAVPFTLCFDIIVIPLELLAVGIYLIKRKRRKLND